MVRRLFVLLLVLILVLLSGCFAQVPRYKDPPYPKGDDVLIFLYRSDSDTNSSTTSTDRGSNTEGSTTTSSRGSTTISGSKTTMSTSTSSDEDGTTTSTSSNNSTTSSDDESEDGDQFDMGPGFSSTFVSQRRGMRQQRNRSRAARANARPAKSKPKTTHNTNLVMQGHVQFAGWDGVEYAYYQY